MQANNTNASAWQTHITVAAVIEHNNKFLLVTDNTSLGLKLNQPAGHVDENESILDAITREVHEETGLHFTPKNIIGIYFYKLNSNNTYLRICFRGETSGNLDSPQPHPDDDGVIAAAWYTKHEIYASSQLRSKMVLQCLEDYLEDKEYPLELLGAYQDCSLLLNQEDA